MFLPLSATSLIRLSSVLSSISGNSLVASHAYLLPFQAISPSTFALLPLVCNWCLVIVTWLITTTTQHPISPMNCFDWIQGSDSYCWIRMFFFLNSFGIDFGKKMFQLKQLWTMVLSSKSEFKITSYTAFILLKIK